VSRYAVAAAVGHIGLGERTAASRVQNQSGPKLLEQRANNRLLRSQQWIELVVIGAGPLLVSSASVDLADVNADAEVKARLVRQEPTDFGQPRTPHQALRPPSRFGVQSGPYRTATSAGSRRCRAGS